MTVAWDLERVIKLAEHVGNPHTKVPSYVHVAGVNGKTSTCIIMEQLLMKGGRLRVGTFIYPPMHKSSDCIRINGNPCSPEHFDQVDREVEQANHLNGLECSFYEKIFLKALLVFMENNSDVIVIEAAMGGKYDATHILKTARKELPAAGEQHHCLGVILTDMTLDHVKYLGPRIEDIVINCSEVIPGLITGKADCPVVVARSQSQIVQNILTHHRIHDVGAVGHFGLMRPQDFILEAPHSVHDVNIDAALRLYDVLAPRFSILYNKNAHRPEPGTLSHLHLPQVMKTFYLGSRQIILDAAQNDTTTIFPSILELAQTKPIHVALGLSAKDFDVIERFCSLWLRLPRARFTLLRFTSPPEHPWIHPVNAHPVKDYLTARGAVVTDLATINEVLAEEGEATSRECILITGSPHIIRDFYNLIQM